MLDLFADDAIWHVPGAMALSGTSTGGDAIIAFLRRTAELTGGTYRVELLWTVADDEHLVAVYRARGERRTAASSTSSRRSWSSSRAAAGRSARAAARQPAFDAFWDG